MRPALRVLAPSAGIALEPRDGWVASPVSVGSDGRDVLVHPGLDTVGLRGAGFELLVTEGDLVEPGIPILVWA